MPLLAPVITMMFGLRSAIGRPLVERRDVRPRR
jgi:hypothetical protein